MKCKPHKQEEIKQSKYCTPVSGKYHKAMRDEMALRNILYLCWMRRNKV